MINLTNFDNTAFKRGAPAWKECIWRIIQQSLFNIECFKIYRLKRNILNHLGANIDKNVIIKPKVKITFPWKLRIDNNSWIGEDVWLLNLDQITIGSNVCISQRSFLCTGNHNWKKNSFDLITKPIIIEDAVWVCANVFIAPGVIIGKNSIIKPGSIVTKHLPPNMICAGNPCRPIRKNN